MVFLPYLPVDTEDWEALEEGRSTRPVEPRSQNHSVEESGPSTRNILREQDINLLYVKLLMISSLFDTASSIGLTTTQPMANKESKIPEEFVLTCICPGYTWPRGTCLSILEATHGLIKLQCLKGLCNLHLVPHFIDAELEVQREQQLVCHQDSLSGACKIKVGPSPTRARTEGRRWHFYVCIWRSVFISPIQKKSPFKDPLLCHSLLTPLKGARRA